MNIPEETYASLIRSGDKKAFEEAFRAYYPLLVRYAERLLNDQEEAEEVVQSLFFNLWLKKEKFQITVSLKSYLYRAAHNDCLNRIKHEQIKLKYAGDFKTQYEGNPGSLPDPLHTKELENRIKEAIESLPEQCRLVFSLSRFEELKYSEIAEQLGISVKTVENHMGKALKLLRGRLKDYLPALLFWIFMK